MTRRTESFLTSGHLPTLAAALLYFDVSFMAWVLFGPLAPFLRDEFGLTGTQQGLLIAIPLLGGSLFRPVLGIIGDRLGGRRAGLIGLTLTLVPLLIGWKFAHTLPHLYMLGFLLGIAGASFAVALPLAGQWYPPKYQGLAMGIAGAGNSGTLLATLFAPRLAERFGWANALGFAMLPVAAVIVAFALMAQDSPRRAPPSTLRDYGAVLKEPDTIWLAVLYSLTFGGFVGFSSFLTTYFHEQYHLSRVTAGDFTTVAVIAGSLLRPVGGWLSDRFGGYRVLVVLLAGFAACVATMSTMPSVFVALAIIFVGMGLLGMGNGAVFQLAPQRFPDRMGLVTGIVGAAGGLGGFFLPTLLGASKDATGQYAPALILVSGAFVLGTIALLELGIRWSRRWRPDAVRQAGIFVYRPSPRPALDESAA
jgi:NNP family nitrate/nitrite transporter-like MFS transporter